MMLITLQQAKAHIRITHDGDDSTIEGLIAGASAAVVTYLKDYALTFLNTAELPEEVLDENSPPEVIDYAVPEDIKVAVKILVAEWFKNREAKQDGEIDSQFGYGYLPRAVIAILYPYRTPTLQ
jgi:hypothetical protein